MPLKDEGSNMSKMYFNGQLVDEDVPVLKASDSGFLYGAGLFETMRVNNGRVFCLEDHVARISESSKDLSIPVAITAQQITEAIEKLLKANNLKDARVRLTATNGPLNSDTPQPTVIITASDFRSYPDQAYKKGISVALTNYRQNSSSPLDGHKTTSYLNRLMALENARKKNCTESLWFTVDNRLAEGSISNVFVVKDGVLYTPEIDTPVLPGVARKNVIELAKQNSIKVIEKSLYIHDLLEADEVFITNVIMKVLGVTNIEKHSVKDFKVGEITKKMSNLFDELVKQKCR